MSDRPAFPRDGFAITPSNTTVFPQDTAVWVGVTGDVVVVTAIGTQLTFNAVAAGTVIPVMVKQVRATSTTATGLIGLR